MNNYEIKLLIMRKITFNNTLKPALLVLMLVLGFTSWGQVTLFSETMGTGATGNPTVTAYAGFQNNSAMFLGNADVRTTSASSGYVGASAGNNVFLSANIGQYFVITGLNTSTYTDLELSFGFRKSSDNTKHISSADFVVEVATNYNSIDNTGTFTQLSYATVTTGAVWSLVTITSTIPSSNNLTIRFRQAQDDAQIRIDDVNVVGILVAPQAPEIIINETVFYGNVGASFNTQISANYNPTSFAVTSGSLPLGLSLNSTTGVISGTPTTVSESEFTITASNLEGSDSADFEISIDKGNQVIAGFVNQISYDTDPPFTFPLTTNIGSSITYTSSNTSVVTVSGSNVFTIQGVGTAQIQAWAAGNSNWNIYNNNTITLTVIAAPNSGLIISQVYGGGGNTSAPWTHDFVELYNLTNSSISLNGKYIQYAGGPQNFSNDISSSRNVSLPNTLIAPKGYFLIQLSGGGVGVPLPTADATGNTSMSATEGKVALTSGLISGSGAPGNPVLPSSAILDIVGYGATTSFSENNNPALGASNTTAVIRKQDGEQDTNDNGNDFVAETPTPRNSSHGIAIWQNGAWTTTPAIDKNAIIRDVLVIDGSTTAKESFEAKSLILDATVDGNNAPVYNASLTIKDTYHIKVDKNIASNGNFIVENGANLVQINDDAVNTGNITVKVNSNPMKRLEWTLWSSPVVGQNLFDFSPQTVTSRIYKYNPSTDEYDNTGINASSVFEKGIGFLFRAPNNYSPTTAQVFEGKFTGVPHNGVVNVSVVPSAFNGLGNPYPSAIDTEEFFDANPGVHTIYFWENVPLTPEGDAYAGPTYVTNTAAGGTIPTALERIAVGQGFIAWIESGTQVTFNNSIRETQKGMFFKTMNNEKHRLWLNLSKTEGNSVNNILVAYMEGASNGFDAQIDGEFFGYEGTALYNIVENSEAVYAVQGRSLPFTDTDIVPLGFRAVQSGSYTISLANFDGLFTDEQDIYLKDNDTEIIHDLKDTAYTFVSEEGVFNDRFEVVYKTTGDLSVTTPEHNNKWVIYSKGNGFQIEAQNFEIKEVMVYDMLGRMVYNSSAEGTSHTIANITNGVLIVKVITADNQTLIRKTAK